MDDLLYFILITVGSIVMFALNSIAEKKRRQGNTPPPLDRHDRGDQLPDYYGDDDENKPVSKDPSEVTWGELFDLIKEVSTPAKPQPRQVTSAAHPMQRQAVQPPVPKPTPKQSYAFEAPEMEGQSVTSAKQSIADDHAYDMPGADMASEIRNTDWRRAVIAHEILKRKF